MKTLIKNTLLGGALLLGSSAAMASPINVGGVVWDPSAAFDFSTTADLFESFAGAVGDEIEGFGKISNINLNTSFCAGCELTFHFKYTLASSTVVAANISVFEFNNGTVDFYVDDSSNYGNISDPSSFSKANAIDGDLWLSLEGNGNLTGTATDLFDVSLINGSGTGFLDVVGGLAASHFDTNTLSNGADLKFQSSFGTTPFATPAGFPLKGSATLSGNSVPEPTSLALLGLGLLGFSATRKRK